MSGDDRVVSLKLVIAGNAETGKTSYLGKWKGVGGAVEPRPTIATELIVHQATSESGRKYTIQIWDTAGQEAYHSITAPYFRNAHGVIIMFDVTNVDSFKALDYWVNMVQENTRIQPVIVIMGNKNDLPSEIPEHSILQYCDKLNFNYFAVSAKTGERIKESIEFVTSRIIDEYEKATKAREELAASCDITGSGSRSSCC